MIIAVIRTINARVLIMIMIAASITDNLSPKLKKKAVALTPPVTRKAPVTGDDEAVFPATKALPAGE